jgi:hypothetical protein
MKHKLIIKSLHDAMLECSCGKWCLFRTGQMTKEEAEKTHANHVQKEKEA